MANLGDILGIALSQAPQSYQQGMQMADMYRKNKQANQWSNLSNMYRANQSLGYSNDDILNQMNAVNPQMAGQMIQNTGMMQQNRKDKLHDLLAKAYAFSAGGNEELTEAVLGETLKLIDPNTNPQAYQGLTKVMGAKPNERFVMLQGIIERMQKSGYFPGANVTSTQRDTENLNESQRIEIAKRNASSREAENLKSPYLESAEQKRGEGAGKAISDVNNMAREAINQNARLDTVMNALTKGSGTGLGKETIMKLRSLGKTFGLDTGDLSGQELIRSIQGEMALRARNPESGLGLTGNTSNRDLEFLKSIVPGLEITEQGNIAIINSLKKINKMKIDLARYQGKLIKENGGKMPMDLETKMLDYANAYEIFTEEERKRMGDMAGSQSGSAPQQAIDYLKNNPQFKNQFKQKYGYLPQGF